MTNITVPVEPTEEMLDVATARILWDAGTPRDTARRAYEAMLSAAPRPDDESAAEQPCQEADGCPTEMAVLKRFWRERNNELARLECKIADRIRELEAEVETGKGAYADLLVNSMREVKAAEAKLRAVGELPWKWRERADDMAWRWARAADELEAVLKGDV